MKTNLLFAGALMCLSMGLKAQTGTYTGPVSVVVGGAYTYTKEEVQYDLVMNEDATLDVTICGYELPGTMIGDLTLGQYTVCNVPYDEAQGGYFKDYTQDGLTMHFKAEQGGVATMDNDYVLQKAGSLLITATETGYCIVNTFSPGMMPFVIVSTAQVTKVNESGAVIISAPEAEMKCYDLKGMPASKGQRWMIRDGKVVLMK